MTGVYGWWWRWCDLQLTEDKMRWANEEKMRPYMYMWWCWWWRWWWIRRRNSRYEKTKWTRGRRRNYIYIRINTIHTNLANKPLPLSPPASIIDQSRGKPRPFSNWGCMWLVDAGKDLLLLVELAGVGGAKLPSYSELPNADEADLGSTEA